MQSAGTAAPAANQKKDFIWNTAGSLTYALSSMVLAFFVMHVMGAEDGGIFGFGFSTFGQQMFIVAYFGIRPFQITDVQRSYSFAVYRRLRFATAGVALLLGGVYLSLLTFFGTYSLYKAAVVFLLAVYKIIDGFADVYESECQRDGALYAGGKALCFRTLLSALIFMAALLLFQNLFAAACAGVMAQLGGLFLFNIRFYHAVAQKQETGTTGRMSGLFFATSLLFLSVFLDFYVFSAAKYAVDRSMTDADNGIFNLLFMPTSFVYLVANFVIKPFMTQLAAAFEAKNRGAFYGICKKLVFLILGLTAFCGIGAALLGRPVLWMLEQFLGNAYDGLLTAHSFAFVLIIMGGGIYALANLYYYILVILRRQRAIFGIYLGAAVLAFGLSGVLVGRGGLFGAALAYLLLMLSLLLGFWAVGRGVLRRAFLRA